MINCIAIDDEPLALELLEDNIRQVPYLHLVDKFSNAINALKLLQETHIDLVFLDIQMPGLTGLQFIQSLSTRPMFILVTAYEKFALEGFNLNVVDYLVKPVSLDRFIMACNRAQELYELRKGMGSAETTKTTEDYFFVNSDYSHVKLMYAQVVYIEGLKDYVRIYLVDDAKPVITRLSMKSIEDELPSSRFIRIHKSYIISTDFVTSVKKSSVVLNGKSELPVGENYRDRIEAMVNKKRLD